ncbi:MAG: PP2C family protein-serine/threonine phosphatase [Candidatus Krumholzibacteriia bacterium]
MAWPVGRGDRLRVGSVHLMVVAEGGETTVGRTLFADALSGPVAVAADLSAVAASRVSLDQVSVSPASLPEGDRLLLSCDDGQDFTVFASRPAQAASASNLILSLTLLGTVLTGREALVLNDATTDARFGGHESIVASRLRSAMVAPLVDSDQVIGLLYADSDDPAARYDAEKLRLFSFLANLIAVKIANARPEVPGYAILARQIPCYEVGGDLHDTAVLDDGRVVVVVGDVTGKGMGAALLMSNTLAALRVLYAGGGPLEAVVERVHRELLQASDDLHFVTLFIGVLDPRTHRLTYVNAGHNPPILLGHDAAPRRLTPTGLPLGLIPGAAYRSAEVDLPPAALLCIHTDGIPEAALGEDFYEDERLIATLDRTRPATRGSLAQQGRGGRRASMDDALHLERLQADARQSRGGHVVVHRARAFEFQHEAGFGGDLAAPGRLHGVLRAAAGDELVGVRLPELDGLVQKIGSGQHDEGARALLAATPPQQPHLQSRVLLVGWQQDRADVVRRPVLLIGE